MSFKCNNIESLIKKNNIVIFGAGVIAKYYVELYNINIKYYADNNPKKWGEKYLGKDIRNPNLLIEDKENIIVFVCSEYEDEISKQLEKLGYSKNVNYYIPRDLEEKFIKDNAGIYEEINYNKGKIIIDISNIAWSSGNSPGISRVVKNLVKVAYEQNDYEVVAAQRAGNNLYEPAQWLEENNIKNKSSEFYWNEIKFNENDILVLADAIWGQYDKFEKVIEDIHLNGGRVFNIIYDIVPIEYPQISNKFISVNLEKMLVSAIKNNDGIITDSKTIADNLISYIQKESIQVKSNFKVGWFHLGFSKSDFVNDNIEQKDVIKIMDKKPFIMIGTIEPKKGHVVSIDAFEELWENDIDVSLCIIGRIGWMVQDLVDRIRNNSEYGKRLFFIEKPADNIVAYCYKNAEALIFPSFAEGFGLPLIEAASYKLPLILSDIPIFKEVAKDNAIYFSSGNYYDLGKSIVKYLELKKDNILPKSECIEVNTWNDSFNELMQVIGKGNWYKIYY